MAEEIGDLGSISVSFLEKLIPRHGGKTHRMAMPTPASNLKPAQVATKRRRAHDGEGVLLDFLVWDGFRRDNLRDCQLEQ